MKTLYLALALMLPLSTGCKTPPDRIAFSALQTSDAALDAAYHVWLTSWKDRRSKAGQTPALTAERDKVADLLAKYQSAHRATLKVAEIAIQSGDQSFRLSLVELSALKAELIAVFAH